MSQSVGVLDISDKKAEGTGIKQYYVVEEGTAADQVIVSGTGGKQVIGSVQTAGATPATAIVAGTPLSIRVLGTSKFVSAGGISRGNACTSNGDGKVKATATDKEYVCCEALEAGTTDGDVFEGLVTHYTMTHS